MRHADPTVLAALKCRAQVGVSPPGSCSDLLENQCNGRTVSRTARARYGEPVFLSSRRERLMGIWSWLKRGASDSGGRTVDELARRLGVSEQDLRAIKPDYRSFEI